MDQVDDIVEAAEALQRLGVGGVAAGFEPAGLGQVELLEQDVAELLGRADVELVADGLVDLRLDVADLLRQGRGKLPQRPLVDGDAVELHPGQHRQQRHLDLAEEAGHPHALQVRLQRLAQATGHVGVGAGEGRGLGDVDLVHGELGAATLAAQELRPVRHFDAEAAGYEPAEAEGALAGAGTAALAEEEGGDHGIEVETPEPQSVACQDHLRELEVVARLLQLVVRQERAQAAEHCSGVEGAVATG